MRKTLLYSGAITSLYLLAQAQAQEVAPVARASGVEWLDWATEQVAFTLREAVPAGAAEVQSKPLPPVDPLAATHSIESIEMHRLQQEIHLLRQLIENEFVARIISLESELQEVKSALRGQGAPGYTGGGPVVPRPDGAPPARPYYPEPEAPVAETMVAVAAEKLPPPAPFSFTVVDEWGRSPEVVAELGGDASTLIGIAGVVPSRSDPADVEALMQQLRTQYDNYDNINIEIFDSETAARAFAERQMADPNHHIASISRHKASGRDVLLYLGGEDAEALAGPGNGG